MTKRIAVAGLAAAVLAGVIVLAISATSSKAEAPKQIMSEATGKTEISEGPVMRTRPPVRRVPEQAGAGDEDTAEPGGEVVEYVRDDGTVVRDHRDVEQPPVVRAVPGTTDVKVRSDVRPLFKECGKQLRARKRQARGRVQAVMTTSIRDGRIKVEALDLQIQGLDDSEYTDCVRKEVEGLELYAPDGQDDVDKHTMTIQFNVP